MDAPEQTGELLAATGAAGIGFITTTDVPAALVQPLTVTVTLYVPAMARVADVKEGFCSALVKDAGPVHAYVAPDTAGVFRLIVCPSQSGELVVAAGAEGTGFTVIVIPADVAVAGLAQGEPEVITQVTTCPFVNVDEVYVDPVPTFVVPTFHWYVGVVPPPLGVAVNVTGVPAQIAPEGAAAMVTPGVTDELTATAVVPAALVQPATVTVTLYVPAIAAVALERLGFCVADV